MKAKKDKKVETGTNYYFILGCLGALTAAALITAGTIAAVLAKAGAATTVTATLTAVATTAATILPILIPIVAVGLLLAGIFTLPFLFSGSSTYTTTNTPGYRSGWGSSWFFAPTPVYTNHGHHHHHGDGFGEHTHGNTHTHIHNNGIDFGGSHHHEHGDVHGGGHSHMHGHRS